MLSRAHTGFVLSRKYIVVLARLGGLFAVLAATITFAQPAGLVVTAVDPGGVAWATPISTGDILIAWRFSDEQVAVEGEFNAPLSLDAVQSQWGWRGKTVLVLQKGASTRAVEVPVGDWGISVRPQLPNDDVVKLQSITQAIANGDGEEAIGDGLRWRDALIENGDYQNAAWLSAEIGAALLSSRDFERAKPFFFEPLGILTTRLPVADRVSVLERHTLQSVDGRSTADRRASIEEAVTLQRTLARNGRLAKLLVHVTAARGRNGDISGAVQAADEAFQLAEALIPRSLTMAKALENQGTIAIGNGRNDDARTFTERAIRLYRKIGAHPDVIAGALTNRGIVSFRRGELSAAQQFYEESLSLASDQPSGVSVQALSLNNLSLVLRQRGDLKSARARLDEALTINTRLDPTSLSVVRNVGNLAEIEVLLGDLASAAARREFVTTFWRNRLPDGTELGYSLLAQAVIADLRNQNDVAEGLYTEAIAHMVRVAPRSDPYADAVGRYAGFLGHQGRTEEALSAIERVAAIRESTAPDSVDLAWAKVIEADLAIATNDLDRAQEAIAIALRIQLRDAPDTSDLAEAYFVESKLLRRTSDAQSVRASLGAAVGVLERQRQWLPDGDQLQQYFSDRYRRIYSAYARSLLDHGDNDAALDAIETYRARSLLTLLADRNIELAAERPPDFANARMNLPQGTLCVSYFALADELVIFVAQAGSDLSVLRVPVGKADLQAEVRRFRHLISEGQFAAELKPALLDSGYTLYQWLIAPLKDRIATTERLLIIPDDELYALPFAALVASRTSEPRFLIEDLPIHVVQSLAIHAELSRRAEQDYSVQFRAYADPVGATSLETHRGSDGKMLPGTRREAKTVAALFAANEAELFLSENATETALLNQEGSPRYLHLATHANFDRHRPLDSYLQLAPPLLSSPGGDDRLQAWEVFEKFQTNADLVTLSACETGAGQLLGSEGLLSLARAFQVAGARNVVATLWAVPDESTTELMVRFYAALRAGEGAPAALRDAQLALIRGPLEIGVTESPSLWVRVRRILSGPARLDARHPYNWAAVQMIGPGSLALH